MVPFNPKHGTPTVAAAICRHPAARPESWYVYICNSQTRNVCHSDRSVSGVEESTTWDNEPTQDKACYLGRFLDSLRSLGMTCRGVVPFNQTGCIRYVASPWRGWSGDESSPLHCTVYWVIPFTGTGYVCHVGCITCGGEWYHPIYGTPTVAAAICRQPARRAGAVVRLNL